MTSEEPVCQIEEMPFDRLIDRIIDSYPIRAAKHIFNMVRRRILALLGARKAQQGSSPRSLPPVSLDLKPGELVEVRSLEEIRSTLDHRDKLAGLTFMPEMAKYCGKRFKVVKRVERYTVEGRGMRRLKNTVFLDGVFCDGQFHGECDRTCFCLWREAWLKRADAV